MTAVEVMSHQEGVDFGRHEVPGDLTRHERCESASRDTHDVYIVEASCLIKFHSIQEYPTWRTHLVRSTDYLTEPKKFTWHKKRYFEVL